MYSLRGDGILWEGHSTALMSILRRHLRVRVITREIGDHYRPPLSLQFYFYKYTT